MTKILYACGVVPFVMTNVPQTLLVRAIRPCNDRRAPLTFYFPSGQRRITWFLVARSTRQTGHSLLAALLAGKVLSSG